jgi:hypothetical protein
MILGKLERVDLRTAWKHEALDFTKWLAQEENLSQLSDEIGIEIESPQTEVSVGSFQADILAEDQDGNKIIIENQLEPSNHDHLGKLITYASGLQAKTIIWIVEDVKDEHKQAIDWLNLHTDGDTSFFAIKMELWKIGDSPPAPKFQIISKPNDWTKAVRTSTGGAPPSETKLLQLQLWSRFTESIANTTTTLRLQRPRPQHWYDLAIGSSVAHIALTMNTQDKTMGCELYIPREKKLFAALASHKEAIEKEFGEQLEWMELPGKKASRIKVSRDADIENEERWDDFFKWLKEKAERFQAVFPKYMKQAQPSN